jgi:hypothetical protein
MPPADLERLLNTGTGEFPHTTVTSNLVRSPALARSWSKQAY